MKTIVALTRYYNSFDHIIPILWKCEKEFNIKILNTNFDTDYSNDPRLKFLSKCEYKDLLDLLTPRYLVSLYKTIIKINELQLVRPVNIFHNKIRKFLNTFFKNKINNIKKIDILSLLNITSVDIILVDFTNDKNLEIICNILKDKGTKIISVPHAIDNWLNNHINENDLNPFFRPCNLMRNFVVNKYLCPSKNDAKRLQYNLGINDKKIEIIGSVRFSDEWREKLKKIYGDEIKILKNKFKHKRIVTFFLTKKNHNVFQEEVFRTISYLSKMKNIIILIKPHTWGHTDYVRYFIKNENIFIVDEYSSFSLQQISKVVIFTATSVVIDTISDKKPLFYLRRTVFNKLIYDNYFSSMAVDCREELFEMVNEALRKNKTNLKKIEISKFMKEIVQPVSKKVLNLYKNRIKQIAYDRK